MSDWEGPATDTLATDVAADKNELVCVHESSKVNGLKHYEIPEYKKLLVMSDVRIREREDSKVSKWRSVERQVNT